MKRYIKQFFLVVALVVGFASCDSEEFDQVDTLSVGGNVVLATTSIKRTDINVDINLKIIPRNESGITAKTIEIYKNDAINTASATVPVNAVVLGTKFVDATIVDPSASAKFSSSVLTTNGIFDYPTLSTGVTPIQLAFVTVYSDGSKTINPFVLSVKK